jgi:hypothetical protein
MNATANIRDEDGNVIASNVSGRVTGREVDEHGVAVTTIEFDDPWFRDLMDRSPRTAYLVWLRAELARRTSSLWELPEQPVDVHQWVLGPGTWTLPDVTPIKEFLDTLPAPEDPHDQRRRPGEVPRPKTTPPMWAPNPARSKRDRRSPRRVK